MKLVIKNGLVLDPGLGSQEIRDVFIENGKFAAAFDFSDAKTLNAAGLAVAPGLFDMHVHLRDPGFLYKEDIETGTRAAARGGFTSVLCMPNTEPVIDSPEVLRYVFEKSAEKGAVNVFSAAALTVGQKGEELAPLSALQRAGAAAFSDDGLPVMNAALMRAGLFAAKALGLPVISHCEDACLTEGGVMNEGAVSEKLGVRGRPAIAEELMVARDAMLAEETGAHVHIAHVSTKRSVDIIRRAKARGVNITCETCPQYFALTEEEVVKQGALAKVNPPLRTAEDVSGIIEGLRDGTIDAIATDHAPHGAEEKNLGLTLAPSGMIGLETALALALTALSGTLPLLEIIRKMTVNPAGILKIDRGSLRPGAAADLVLFDPKEKWTADPAAFASKARNTPFSGRELTGKVKYALVSGAIV